MKKRVFAAVLSLMLLPAAHAEFYTANEDLYYHAKADCVAGSTFEISEHAAHQFEKLACPVCVDRASVGGELIEIDLPGGYVSLQNVDFKDGKLMLCGYADMQNSKPWLAVYDLQGAKLQEYTGEATDDIIRDAKFLPDGKIAIIRSIGGVEGKWHVQLVQDGKIVHQSDGAQYLSRIWPLDDGFFLYGSTKMYEYRLAKCDNDGNVLWTMDMDMFPLSDGQPGLTDILTGDGIHIAYGKNDAAGIGSRPVIVAFDDNGQIIARHQVERIAGRHTQTLYDENMQPVGYEILDSYMGSYRDGTWAQGGLLLAGANSVTRYEGQAESWFCDLADCLWDENGCLIQDGKRVERGSAADMIQWNGGCLLAMTVDVYTPMLGSRDEPAGRGYVRMVQISPEGKITRDWFEEIGDIAFDEKIHIFSHGGDLYLFAEGGTIIPMQAYEEGYPTYKIPRKALIKRINA